MLLWDWGHQSCPCWRNISRLEIDALFWELQWRLNESHDLLRNSVFTQKVAGVRNRNREPEIVALPKLGEETTVVIDRRRFLTASLGLGLGIDNGAAGEDRLAGNRNPKYDIPAVRPGLAEYEQILAQTENLNPLGVPRSWSVVREGFLPLSPERVVILKARDDPYHDDPGDRWGCNLAERGVRDRIVERLWQESTREDESMCLAEKGSLILRMTKHLVEHYAIQDRIEDWAIQFAGRESLGSTGIGRQVAMPEIHLCPGTVPTANSFVDWWLFLFPEGVRCWGSLDNQPVHAMMLHVLSEPNMPGVRITVCYLIQETLGSILESSTAIDLSRMDRIDAARFVNQHAVRALTRL